VPRIQVQEAGLPGDRPPLATSSVYVLGNKFTGYSQVVLPPDLDTSASLEQCRYGDVTR
jgi:hypothetical protein